MLSDTVRKFEVRCDVLTVKGNYWANLSTSDEKEKIRQGKNVHTQYMLLDTKTLKKDGRSKKRGEENYLRLQKTGN